MTFARVGSIQTRIQSASSATAMSLRVSTTPHFCQRFPLFTSRYSQRCVSISAQSFPHPSDHKPYCDYLLALIHDYLLSPGYASTAPAERTTQSTAAMPAIAHLQARFLDDSGSGSPITGTAIALIICLGLLPCIAVIWAVCYLFWAYPYDRNWCCMKRKRRPESPSVLNQVPMSQETLYEKQGMGLPQRPFAAQTRTESGGSSNGGRLQKQYRPGSGNYKRDTRTSLQSMTSINSGHIAHEPKPFV